MFGCGVWREKNFLYAKAQRGFNENEGHIKEFKKSGCYLLGNGERKATQEKKRNGKQMRKRNILPYANAKTIRGDKKGEP